MDLDEAFCGDEQLPDDMNLSLMVFLDEKSEAALHAHTPSMVFRYFLDTRPLPPLPWKQAGNKQAARVLNFCISPVVEKFAIDMQMGVHSWQAAGAGCAGP